MLTGSNLSMGWPFTRKWGCTLLPHSLCFRWAHSSRARTRDLWRLSPAALVIPVLGGLRLLGEQLGFYGPEFGVSLSVASSVVLFAALIWWCAASLNRLQARHQRAEDEVRVSEEQFRAVARTAKDAIISADQQGNIIYFNAAAERMFGFPAEAVIGTPLARLMPERFREAHRRGMD